jgi:hypothetical protein
MRLNHKLQPSDVIKTQAHVPRRRQCTTYDMGDPLTHCSLSIMTKVETAEQVVLQAGG